MPKPASRAGSSHAETVTTRRSTAPARSSRPSEINEPTRKNTLRVPRVSAGSERWKSRAIGGPPMALLFQRSDPAEARGTPSVFFLVGSLISLGLLLLAGAVDLRVVTVSAWLLPALLAGFGISRLLVPYVNRNRMRVLAITMSCLSATVLLGQQLWRLLG